MEALARMMVASMELIEAEGRVLKKAIFQMAVGFALGVLATVLIMIGMGFLIYGLYLYVAGTALGPAGAATLFGVIALILATVGSYFAKKLILPTRTHGDLHARDRDREGTTSEKIEAATERAQAHTERVPMPTGERITETSYATTR